jgi:putative membrane protein
MKQNNFLFWLCIGASLLFACLHQQKDSVQRADSTNQAHQDSALQHSPAPVIDETSSAFTVRAYNQELLFMQSALFAQQKSVYPSVRDFAGSLYKQESSILDSIKLLSSNKQIALPNTLSGHEQESLNILQSKTGKNIDRQFINNFINAIRAYSSELEKAQLDTKDLDVRALAGRLLIKSKDQLQSANSLKEKLW